MHCLTLVFQDETLERHTGAAEPGRTAEEAVRSLFASLCINCVVVTPNTVLLFSRHKFVAPICARVCVIK